VSYYYTLPDGRQMNQQEWNEYSNKKLEAEIAAQQRAEEEAARLERELAAAYKACAGFRKSHPELVRKVGDAEAQEHELYMKLRKNLERADEAPRCEKVREDGTLCQCPRMKGYRYCYAHERMLQAKPRKLALPALEDANSIQLAVMMVQKALIDDEISEKNAGLLLYSLQIVSSNAKRTTFGDEFDKEVVAEMPEEEGVSSQHSAVSSNTYHGGSETRRRHGSVDRGIGRSGDLVESPRSEEPTAD